MPSGVWGLLLRDLPARWNVSELSRCSRVRKSVHVNVSETVNVSIEMENAPNTPVFPTNLRADHTFKLLKT